MTSVFKIAPLVPTTMRMSLPPGEVHVTSDAVLVGTGSAPARLERLAPPGRAWMAATDWARGARLGPGWRFDVDQQDGTDG